MPISDGSVTIVIEKIDFDYRQISELVCEQRSQVTRRRQRSPLANIQSGGLPQQSIQRVTGGIGKRSGKRGVFIRAYLGKTSDTQALVGHSQRDSNDDRANQSN
jgi:hypothetical protein